MAKKKSLKGKAEASRSASRNAPPLYSRKQANRISMWVIIVVAVLLGGYIAVESAIDPASVSGGQVRVRSLFGFSVPIAEISDLKLEEGALVTRTRIFGNDAFGIFREGDFTVDGLGTTRVFLKKPNVSYLSFRTEAKSYAINLGSQEKNQRLYDEIRLGAK
jgi:hypothetical protein